MLGPTIYIPSALAKLLIPLTSSRGQMLALVSLADHRFCAAERDRVAQSVANRERSMAAWRSSRGLACCTA